MEEKQKHVFKNEEKWRQSVPKAVNGKFEDYEETRKWMQDSSDEEGSESDGELDVDKLKEARNTPFCPSHEKFHSVVLRGVRNMFEPRKIPL